MKKHLKRVAYGTGLGVLAAFIVWVFTFYVAPELMYLYEAGSYDWRVKQKVLDSPEQNIDEIVVIDIDGRSVSELGKFSQWPRNYYPQLIENLNSGGASAIGLDIIFDKDIWRPEYDVQFINAVKEANNIYNALYFGVADTLNFRYEMQSEPAGFDSERFKVRIGNSRSVGFHSEERFENEFIKLLNASRAVGHVNFIADADGVVRSIHPFTNFNGNLYPSLALRMYMDLSGVDSLVLQTPRELHMYSSGQTVQTIPLDANGNMRINYYGPYKSFRYISFYDVLENRLPADYYAGKVFFVGTSLAGLFDLRNTPVQQAFPGVEIHANILKMLFEGDFVGRTSPIQTLIIMIIIGALLGAVMLYLKPVWSIVLVLLSVGLYVVVVNAIFSESNMWVDMVAPVFTMFVTFSAVYIYRFATEERKKRFIRSTFSHFVTKSVVDELLANPEKIKLGGEKKNCTVFFSDVAGFTTISEQLSPEALVSLLNDYLTQMTNIVFKYDGMLDKYEGDAIMAVFGAPIAQGNHAYNACAAALEMQSTLVRMRDLWRKQGKPELTARCGINTGLMVVGNMGSETRFDYTVMGDAVNLGARLEPANKEYATQIMIGPETYAMAKEKIIARQLDLLRVKGKMQPVKVYELVGTVEKGVSEDTLRVLELFNRGFEEYLQQHWEWAINFFEQALSINSKDGPCRRYIRRCRFFKENPPGEEWDGVFTMKTK